MSQAEFTVLLTSDQNIKYEQNLKKAGVSVIVMVARTNRLTDLVRLKPKIINALFVIKPGELIEVSSD